MRPPEGGTFPLPSVARLIALPSPHTSTCEKSRQHAIDDDSTDVLTAGCWRRAREAVKWSTSTMTRCRGPA